MEHPPALEQSRLDRALEHLEIGALVLLVVLTALVLLMSLNQSRTNGTVLRELRASQVAADARSDNAVAEVVLRSRSATCEEIRLAFENAGFDAVVECQRRDPEPVPTVTKTVTRPRPRATVTIRTTATKTVRPPAKGKGKP